MTITAESSPQSNADQEPNPEQDVVCEQNTEMGSAIVDSNTQEVGSVMPPKRLSTRMSTWFVSRSSFLSQRTSTGDLEEQELHAAEFKARTGVSPSSCYWLLVISNMLRIIGGTFAFMVALEYTRYYVVNDLSMMSFLHVAGGTITNLVQGIFYPIFGKISDRVSRKRILVVASAAQCCTVCLLTFLPSINTYFITRALSLISDLGSPIRDAMLRDIFSKSEWEKMQGGATGIKARLGIIVGVVWAFTILSGMAILKLGDMGIGLPNEYTVRKEECKDQKHCVPPGQFSWEGGWEIDGCLRLMMLIGSAALVLEVLLVTLFFPETVPPQHRVTGSMLTYVKENWKNLKPWGNLRVVATSQLRELMSIRLIVYLVGAGGGVMWLSWYQRFEFDTFTMFIHSMSAGGAAWCVSLTVPTLVRRFGDLRGVWIPGYVLGLMGGIAWVFMPAGTGFLAYPIYALLVGPSGSFTGLAPEVMTKLLPADVQGTFQTGKSFLFKIIMATVPWFWQRIFVMSREYPYPLDTLPLMGGQVLGLIGLCLTLRALRRDPRDAINNGKALEAFWQSEYVLSGNYRKDGGSHGPDVEATPHRSNLPRQRTLPVFAALLPTWPFYTSPWVRRSRAATEEIPTEANEAELAPAPSRTYGGNQAVDYVAQPQPALDAAGLSHAHHAQASVAELPPARSVTLDSSSLADSYAVAPQPDLDFSGLSHDRQAQAVAV